MKNNLKPQPVFIVACPRSGSTKLAALLDAHAQVASMTETHYFNYLAKQKTFFKKDYFRYENIELFVDEPRVMDFLRSLKMEQEQFREKLSRTTALTKKTLFDFFLQLFAEAKSATHVCEKTPQHLQNVLEIKKLYPEAKFIFLLRDGRDVVNSLLQMPWRPDGLWSNARYWQNYIKSAEKVKAKLDSSSFFEIRFEDLAADTEGYTRRLCDFVGVKYSEEMLAAPPSKIFANWEAEWKYKSQMEMDSSRIGAWQAELDEKQKKLLQWFIGADLKKLAYV